MILDLRNGKLGDLLLALPAIRTGDSVILRPQFRLDLLPVKWLDEGEGVRAWAKPGQHTTDAWLEATKRRRKRWRLLPVTVKRLTVIAPCVDDPRRQWRGWEELGTRLPHAVWLDDKTPRLEWMRILNRARTVICPDTGTAHMADALGCPHVVGLYAALFKSHAPYWNRGSCVVRSSMNLVTVEDVMEQVQQEPLLQWQLVSNWNRTMQAVDSMEEIDTTTIDDLGMSQLVNWAEFSANE